LAQSPTFSTLSPKAGVCGMVTALFHLCCRSGGLLKLGRRLARWKIRGGAGLVASIARRQPGLYTSVMLNVWAIRWPCGGVTTRSQWCVSCELLVGGLI